jgi:arylformamidase
MNQNGSRNNDGRFITISREFIDLTHIINKNIQVYPGDPETIFESVTNIGKDANANITRITIGSHTGTHVDAHKHFISNGIGVDKEPPDKFIGEAVVLDMSNIQNGQGITSLDLERNASLVKSGDIILLYTGTTPKFYSKYVENNNNNESKKIVSNFTYLELSAAEWIVDHDIKCVGIDTLSVESEYITEGSIHKKLLSHDIGIIENLNSNLQRLVDKRIFLICLPLLFEDLDGSPARAIVFDIMTQHKK